MRVLVVPEFYRPQDATANGTVNDALAWIREWLDRDATVHVYLLGVPRERARGDSTLLPPSDRVTLVEAEPALANLEPGEPFTETGYSADQLRALRRAIFEPGAYVDVVVDQLRFGRSTLTKWLLEHSDQWAARVRPFDVVANVHDLQYPFKHRFCSYRNEFQYRQEAAAAAFADGVWFTAGVDARRFQDQVDFLDDDVVERVAEESIVTGSPIDFDRFDRRYADRPERVHLAGSLWAKKNADRLFDVASRLHDSYGLDTVLTSVEEIPERYRRPEWVDAYPEASRATYEDALAAGDLALCASDYETMARTPFEQIAAGQVLVAREAPWLEECLPTDYPLVGPLDDLPALASRAVENWEMARTESQKLVARARQVRGERACGRRTYRDLRQRVEGKQTRYDGGKCPGIVRRAAEDCGERFTLEEVARRTARYDDGVALPDSESYAYIDLVYTLRALGYEDEGNPGTPVFRRQDSPVT